MKNIVNMAICERRQRSTDHFLPLDKTILFAYPDLSDGARLTYMALDSYDWISEDGTSKGYVYPSQATLAKVRGITERTLRRHLDELEQAGLITTQVITTAHGRHNVYVIHNASNEEVERYLALMDKPTEQEPVSITSAQSAVAAANYVEDDLTQTAEHVCMGADKNDRYKEDKLLSIKDQKQDQTVLSGPVDSLSPKTNFPTQGLESATDGLPESCEPLPDILYDEFVDILGRYPSSTEERHLAGLVQLYSSDEVKLALSELMVARELRSVHSPTRYIAGVLRNWSREGRRVTNMLEHLRRVEQMQVA
jgi:DNA-binding MarR family transcriptional regulator